MGGNFYKDKPLFGIDLGFNTAKIMQLHNDKNGYRVTGYGISSFDSDAIVNGVIEKPEVIAKTIYEMFNNGGLIGTITSKRVALCIPASRAFHRSVQLPKISSKDVGNAIIMETEQYLPVAVSELYLDYQIVGQHDTTTDLFVVAAPQNIVDSYVKLAALLGLEIAAVETTIASAVRLFTNIHGDNNEEGPNILVDFGSRSCDITITDSGSIIVTGTIPYGGDFFTDSIAQKLRVSKGEAHTIKVRYGIGESKKRKEIMEAIAPGLDQLQKEIRKMIRYYHERGGGKKTISRIITSGGGANMPGLHDYLKERTGIVTSKFDPWEKISFGRLQPPQDLEKSVYTTVAGLALIRSSEIHES